uniref:Protein TIC 214 n=1 Tax=Tanacetum cinerariifolium TaxID=118510 RepID=A0A6L2KNU5_TANCI|nr:hypothetical protein [Tanacetum cinerariifolium]
MNVVKNKNLIANVNAINALKRLVDVLCVSCDKNVLIPCHDKCFAKYKLFVNANVGRALFTTPGTVKYKFVDTTPVIAKTRFVVFTPFTMKERDSSDLQSTLLLEPASTLSNYMRTKVHIRMERQSPLVSPSQELGPRNHYFLSCLSSFMVRYSGVLGVEEPHQSISNLVVKLYCDDDTIGEKRKREVVMILKSFLLGTSYLFLLQAHVMEEGTEKKVSATTGFIMGQLIMFILIYRKKYCLNVKNDMSPQDNTPMATANIDADLQDHTGCHNNCKSTFGGIQFLGHKLVSLSSKKKDCTTMSTAKAEYVSLYEYGAQVFWMRTELLDYGFCCNKISMYCDSKSAIAILCNPNKSSIHYPRITKLIIDDRIEKYESIPKMLEEEYHTIKDDTPMVNMYTTGQVTICGTHIPNDFVTDVIKDTQAYKDYVEMYKGVEVPTIQPELVESTQGTHMTPRATKTPNLVVVYKKRVDKTAKVYEEQQIVAAVEKKILEKYVEKLVEVEDESDGDEFADTVILSDEHSGDKIEPGSHKKKPKEIVIDDEKNDDDDKNDDAKDDKDDDDNDGDDQSLIRTQRRVV